MKSQSAFTFTIKDISENLKFTCIPKNMIFFLFAFAVSTAIAQQAATSRGSKYPTVVNFTAEQDHQHMIDQYVFISYGHPSMAMLKS